MGEVLTKRRFTQSLLAIERLRSGSYRTTRIYPAVGAFLNLFFCAYAERYVKNDPTGYYLSIFVFMEMVAYMVIAGTTFFTISQEILLKSRVFPVGPSQRLYFLVASNWRRPMILSLVASCIFFLLILFRKDPLKAMMIATTFLLMFAVTDLLVSSILSSLSMRSTPAGTLIMIFGILFLGFLIGVFVFHYETLATSIPVIRWTVNGMLAVTRGEFGSVAINSLWLVLSGCALVLIGRKIA